jgi:NADPH:quinone reductase-like Zn-dependent oxidoreductase
MRALVFTAAGGPEVLQVQERPDPGPPGPDEILIDVGAAGVNFSDLLARMGMYQDAPKPPCVIGYEVAGTVAAVGSRVTARKVGDRVVAGTRFGGQAEKVVVKAQDTVELPDGLSWVEGAAVPVNYATAWAALRQYGSVQPGERVLIHAAAGGVGTAATQLAKRFGAEVFGTASPGKHDAIRQIGVDVPIDYTRPDWWKGLPKFDVVLDPIGGRNLGRSHRLLAVGGRLVAFGVSSMVSGETRNLLNVARTVAETPWFSVLKQMSESKAVIGLNMLRLWDAKGTLEPWIGPLKELLDDGTIRPVIAGAFPFDRAAEAHEMLAQRRNVGKVVLHP